MDLYKQIKEVIDKYTWFEDTKYYDHEEHIKEVLLNNPNTVKYDGSKLYVCFDKDKWMKINPPCLL